MKLVKPFGLLFEQKPSEDISLPKAFYDEDLSVSVILDKKGNKHPAVATPLLTTETSSYERDEATDEDQEQNSSIYLSTETATKASNESTDDD